MRTFYLTTTLPYVNSDPHIGNALEFVQADVIARFARLSGDQVFFNMGTDEHGQKIFQAAEKSGQDVHAYVDHYSNEFKKLIEALALSPDAFIRTTDSHHYRAAEEMWRRCAAAGDIYKKTYTGMYCIGCEAYKTEKELDENGKCVVHPSLTPETISEENYFFRFSKYQEKLLEYLNRPDVIIPEWRRVEGVNFLKAGLEDFSISREKKRLSWGIPVPGDDSQVMYVWFEALISYISTLGWPDDAEGNFKRFWGEGYTLQVAGKDQVRFQSLMWQAILMSADIKNTDQVFYHGFINSGGHRMSKSLGNVITPYDLIKKYGVDATRYLLLRHVHPMEDTDVTWERLDEWYTAGLVNGAGNLTARIMKMAEDNLAAPVSVDSHTQTLKGYLPEKIGEFRFDLAMEHIWAKIAEADVEVQNKKPWESKDKEVIASLVLDLYRIGRMLEPFMPETSKKIIDGTRENKKPENLFPRLG